MGNAFFRVLAEHSNCLSLSAAVRNDNSENVNRSMLFYGLIIASSDASPAEASALWSNKWDF